MTIRSLVLAQIGNHTTDYNTAIKPNHHLQNQMDIYKQTREGLRSALATLHTLQTKEHVSGEKRTSNGDTMEKPRTRACPAKKKKYTHDSSDNHNRIDCERIQPSVENQPKIKLQRKTVLSYHSMKRKNLVELCNKEGLPTNGTDEELKKRHSEFITLYNSECDAEYPRSVSDLIKEIKKRESGVKVGFFEFITVSIASEMFIL